MGGTIVTWLQNTEKLVSASSRARSNVSAVDGAMHHGAVHGADVAAGPRARAHHFSVFCNHVTIGPDHQGHPRVADLRLDGFLGPGRVSTVVGNRRAGWCPSSTAGAGDGRLRAARRPAGHRHAAGPSSARAAARWRTSPPACVHNKGAPVPSPRWPRSSSPAARSSGGASGSSPERAQAEASIRPVRCRAALDIPGVRVADPKACHAARCSRA